MKSYEVVGYTYQADLYCPDCIAEIGTAAIVALTPGDTLRERVGVFPETETLLNRWAKLVSINRDDEATFDSGDFPKVVFADMVTDEHCGACHRSLV